jgi:hypothetical protein
MGVSWLRASLLTVAAGLLALSAGRLGDYKAEAAPSLDALAHGDFTRFAHAPNVYAGSLTLRAPFVGLAGALGGDRLDVYRAGIFACLLAAVALIVVLDRAAQRAGAPIASRIAVAASVLGLPLLVDLFDFGHPEEVLTASLAILAVWAAPRSPLIAGALLGTAVACKPWALVALGPVLLCAAGGRMALLVATAAAGLASVIPFLAADLGHSAQVAATNAATGTLWAPFQLFWPLGVAHHHAVPDGVGGVLDLTTWTAPRWLGPATRALIVGLTVPAAVMAFARGRRSRADALLLLALLLHLRCLFDPWNSFYYALPAILALVAWSVERRERFPLAAAALAALVWLTFNRLALVDDRALMFAGYVAWALPFAFVIATWLYRPEPARLRLGALSPARP